MEGPSNGLGKLLPKSITRRRKGPPSLAETTSSNDDVALQKENSNPNLSRSTTSSDKSAVENGNRGNSEGVRNEDDKTAEFKTQDSDLES